MQRERASSQRAHRYSNVVKTQRVQSAEKQVDPEASRHVFLLRKNSTRQKETNQIISIKVTAGLFFTADEEKLLVILPMCLYNLIYFTKT